MQSKISQSTINPQLSQSDLQVKTKQKYNELMNKSWESQFDQIKNNLKRLEAQETIRKEIDKNPQAYFIKEQMMKVEADAKKEKKKKMNVHFELPKLVWTSINKKPNSLILLTLNYNVNLSFANLLLSRLAELKSI